MIPFHDRIDAGRQLAQSVSKLIAPGEDVVVLGLTRGGVPVAAQVAQELHAPLDALVVRKIGVPGQPELAMGAVARGGQVITNQDVLDCFHIDTRVFANSAADKSAELERQEALYRRNRPAPDLSGKTVVIVDDGIATGASMRVAALSVKQNNARRIIVATPVAAAAVGAIFADAVDDFVSVYSPLDFCAVGRWYEDFSQVADEEVIELLQPDFPVFSA